MEDEELGNSETAVPDGLDVAFVGGGDGFFNLEEGVPQEDAAFGCSLWIAAAKMADC